MSKYEEENLIDYADMRIKDINNYIDFNERRGEKDFFANKELELFKIEKETLDKQAILKAKAWDITKKKRVDVDYMIVCLKHSNEPLRKYNIYAFNVEPNYELTKEEFNLIKQALEIEE